MISGSLLFTPSAIGPLTLRNRTIRAAAFEGMCIEQSLYTFSQTIGFVLFEKIPVNQLFNKYQISTPVDDFPNLFSFSES